MQNQLRLQTGVLSMAGLLVCGGLLSLCGCSHDAPPESPNATTAAPARTPDQISQTAAEKAEKRGNK